MCIVRTQQLKIEIGLASGAAIAHLQPVFVLSNHQDLRVGARAGAKIDGFAAEVAPEL